MLYTYFKYILLFGFICCFSCCNYGQQVKQKPTVDSLSSDWNQTIPGNFSSQSKTVFDSTQIEKFLVHFPDLKVYAAEINSFYKRRGYAYAWFEAGKLIEQAGNLSNRVSNLQNEGVYKRPPYQKELDSLIYGVGFLKKKPNIQLELMLTAQYFAFSNMAWQGMNNKVSQSVPHLHVHVVPRRKKDGLKGFFWPRTKYKNEEEMLIVQNAIRLAVTKLT